MKKILVSIKKNYLAFSYKRSTGINQAKLLNTNVISDNELLFSEEYINNNPKIVSGFIKELCKEYNIHIIAFQKNDMFELLFPLFSKNQYIKTLYLFEEVSLSYTICEALSKNNYVKLISCYNVPEFMIEMLDKKGIEVNSRNEILFTSNFMEENNLIQFSKIFYKLSVKFKLPLSQNDIEDFKTFCKINKYLRTIHLEEVNIEDIEKILDVLNENRISKIKILIHDNITDEETISNLKKINKSSKKNKITFQLVYSEDYLKSNVINQTMGGILKICGGIIGCLILAVVGYIMYTNYDSMNKDVQIKKEINAIIENSKKEEPTTPEEPENPEDPATPEDPDDPENPEDPGENDNGDTEKKKKKKKEEINNTYLASLLQINDDAVGWLKVNNTNIDYPIVQAEDNDYYLKRNFYRENDKAGWIFMDYRNNPNDLDQNTIFYGHNRYSNGVMFGTLQKTLNKDWYKNSKNQYIEFNTINANMKWRIFSIYKVDVTTDYLKISFKDDEEWMEFTDKLKKRSIYDFGVTINPDDKIISLSTCMGSNNQQRLVVHAVLEK